MVISVLIVADYYLIREGVRNLLERDPDLKVVGEAVNAAETVEKAHLLRPDVVLMDLFLPGSDGITTIAVLHREVPTTAIIALANTIEGVSVLAAIRAGAIGYLLHNVNDVELLMAIKAAAARQLYLSSQASSLFLRELRNLDRSTSLTEREIDVLRLLAQGASNKDIAQQLHLTEAATKTHIRHILAKLNVQSRAQVILVARRLRLVAPDSRSIDANSFPQ